MSNQSNLRNHTTWLLPLLASWVLALSSCANTGASAETDDRAEEARVIEVAQAFFDAMEARDVAAATSIMIPEGVFVSLRPAAEESLRHFDNASWLARLADRRAEVREEFVGTPVVLVDDHVAMVWAEYRFEIDGVLAHTGVDVFTLIRTAGEWKIAGGVYSVIAADENGE